MSIVWQWKKFEDLSRNELHQILRARQKVFIIEQDCIYEDADDLDESAWHLFNWKKDGNGDLVLAAYLRVLPPGKIYTEVTFGRVLVAAEFRGIRLGEALIAKAIKCIEDEFLTQSIRISAQEYLEKFYQNFGFQRCNAPYEEDGILHLEMFK
ncbi:MAG: ElaA protein [Flavobacterium sp.]